MNLYDRLILPRLLDCVMGTPMLQPFRARVVGAARGAVLEIGVGSGLNLGFYGAGVRSVAGIDPSAALLRKAQARVEGAAMPVRLHQGSAENLPFAPASMDTVVTTWSLCTIPDAAQALGEVMRVLKPDGTLLFVEHGRAPEASVARWQDRLDRPWGVIAGGCHINRPIDALIRQAGFRIARLAHERLAGPPTHNFLYEGSACPH